MIFRKRRMYCAASRPKRQQVKQAARGQKTSHPTPLFLMEGNNACAETLQAGRQRVMFKTRGNFIRAVIFSLFYKDSYFYGILHRNCYYVQHTRKMWFSVPQSSQSASAN